ncbi:DUF4226 domain-containing protein [Nocardia sp. CA-107356]|uniref:DUF4226 domain-containing protein n=1 Tax=Nocardia sp. CA-107356 TaxID=3239972 RepID=UPI003D8FB59A
MTSAEVWPADYQVEVVDEPTEGAGEEGDSQSGPVTPWSGRQGHKAAPRTGTAPLNPGSGSSPGQNGAPATPQGQAGQGGSAPGVTAAPQGNIVVPPGPGAGQPTQPPAPQARAAPAEPAPPLVDPDTVAALAPAALSAGTMAMGMLPMLASALAGLGSGSGGSGSGSGTGSGADSGGADGSEGGLSPEAQKALQALKLLAAVYGDGKTDDPEVKQLRQQMGINGSGSGATAIKARQLFQKNAATAFNNLDNQLASYITGLAGNHTVDKKAVTALIREVNVALAELGPQAYTKAGRQKVHQILTTALQKASQIVTGTQASSTDTANAINRLTNQYLYNIAGKKYAGSAAGTSAAAQKAVQVAMAQQGDPYVGGAEGPNSFDCSGLMQYAAAQAGVSIPRVASAQYQQLPKVNPADIRPGDLIFPDSEFNNGNPGHVMMYIGNGQCVEAPHTGDVVKVISLPRGYHATRWS